MGERFDGFTEMLSKELARLIGRYVPVGYTHVIMLWLFPNKRTLDEANNTRLYPQAVEEKPPEVDSYNQEKFEEVLVKAKKTVFYLGYAGFVNLGQEVILDIRQNYFINPKTIKKLYPLNKGGPVIGLGAAELRRDDRLQPEPGRADYTKLSWKWTPLLVSKELIAKKKKEGKEDEKILRDIEKRVKNYMRDNKLKNNVEQTLKWHKDKKDADKLKKIHDDIENLEKKHPEFFKYPRIKQTYYDAMAALSQTSHAWEVETGSLFEGNERLKHQTMYGLMKKILWLEKAIEYLEKKSKK